MTGSLLGLLALAIEVEPTQPVRQHCSQKHRTRNGSSHDKGSDRRDSCCDDQGGAYSIERTKHQRDITVSG